MARLFILPFSRRSCLMCAVMIRRTDFAEYCRVTIFETQIYLTIWKRQLNINNWQLNLFLKFVLTTQQWWRSEMLRYLSFALPVSWPLCKPLFILTQLGAALALRKDPRRDGVGGFQLSLLMRLGVFLVRQIFFCVQELVMTFFCSQLSCDYFKSFMNVFVSKIKNLFSL